MNGAFCCVNTNALLTQSIPSVNIIAWFLFSISQAAVQILLKCRGAERFSIPLSTGFLKDLNTD